MVVQRVAGWQPFYVNRSILLHYDNAFGRDNKTAQVS